MKSRLLNLPALSYGLPLSVYVYVCMYGKGKYVELSVITM